IGADPAQIEAAGRTGAAVIELHTGAYCDAARDGHIEEAERLLVGLRAGATLAVSLGLEVHAGHGIDYETVAPIAAIPEVAELNIGHFLVGEAIFIGLGPAVVEMRRRIDAAREGA
ncbi:MAG: pyridoxine 5'-phosphate synthase, partial [Hyphomonadaceae bacterium]